MKRRNDVEIGEVIHLLPDDTASVRIRKGPSCDSCSRRGDVCEPFGGGFMVVRAANALRARPGQVVQVSFTAAKSPQAILSFSILPLAALILGAALGHRLAFFGSQSLSGALLGLVFAALTLSGLWLRSRRNRAAQPTDQPHISRIVN